MKRGSTFFLILLILTCSIVGTIIGNAFSSYFPILNYGESIGFGPATLDLNLVSFTLGFNANLTVAGIIGLLIAIIAYRKL
ncbi:DUF4321 domain-containing protein [Sedimentibacter sp. MB31-C6]|uniref:DUF4321 domain-containing protein n=1 Tax=Sedimentibacter sp. MB31-C6 TaxID=3109366 RepID=UPI002DDD5ADA|nr:DUF4321 domain-containing protein [Sedimentibacter sp. MB36-C1]WSI04387.1 DUF4321 domain-containing protein [Sedimentibacter sp. MB36-C1]